MNANAAQRRVLIVDDSFLMRRVIRNIIERDEGLVVAGEAADGMEALEMVAALAPEVILLDIEMPRMDGIEFLRRAQLI
ncbi:MAG TPA: response regulator, partial [Moraxellaceae bacterium]